MIDKKYKRAITKERLRSFFVKNNEKAFGGDQDNEYLWSKLCKLKISIFLLLLSFVLTGCPGPDYGRESRAFILENKSNHSLELKFYNEEVLLDYQTTILDNNGEQFRERIDYSNERDLFSFPARAFNVDSIVIEFDSSKRLSYAIDFINRTYSLPLNRNIFIHENYENLGNDQFLYSITEEDYNRAEDIN